MHKIHFILLISFVVFIISGVFLFFRINEYRKMSARTQLTETVVGVPTAMPRQDTSSQLRESQKAQFIDPNEYLERITTTVEQVTWDQVTEEEVLYPYNGQTLVMKKLSGSYTLNSLSDPRVQLDDQKPAGWEQDSYLAADGPGGGRWGYTHTENGRRQIVAFLRNNTTEITKEQDEELLCPCEMNLIIWVSEPFEDVSENSL